MNLEKSDDSKKASTLISLSEKHKDNNKMISESIDANYTNTTSFVLPLASNVQKKHLTILMQSYTEMSGERNVDKSLV
jgi:hypothetical protein